MIGIGTVTSTPAGNYDFAVGNVYNSVAGGVIPAGRTPVSILGDAQVFVRNTTSCSSVNDCSGQGYCVGINQCMCDNGIVTLTITCRLWWIDMCTNMLW